MVADRKWVERNLGFDPLSLPAQGGDGALPKADVLVATWTVDEGHALSPVLTPGKNSRNDYVSYAHNYEAISQNMKTWLPCPPGKAAWRVLDRQNRR